MVFAALPCRYCGTIHVLGAFVEMPGTAIRLREEIKF